VLRRFPELSRDGWLLFLTCGVRAFAYGLLSVVLGLYLIELGFDTTTVGLLFTVALGGAAAMTLVLTASADRTGRRRILVLGALLMAAAASVFTLTDNLLVLAVAAVLGTVNPSRAEVGPFPSIEQAMLPQVTSATDRTAVFSWYNLVKSAALAFGALAAGLPALAGLELLAAYRLVILGYVALALVLAVLFSRLSARVEVESAPAGQARRFGIHRSRGIVARLAALFALDAFGGGFLVDSLTAYWLNQRFGIDVAGLGAIFFGTGLVTAISFLAAPPLARRFGLVNTMVFTHLPSNVLIMLVPLMPGVEAAVGLLLVRNLLSNLDVPTRQSYIMAVVAPDERATANGLLSVTRSACVAIAPAFAGFTLSPALIPFGLPLILAGGLKIVYDLALLASFRNVRPPEER
jgi:MFS family permease